MYAYVISSLLPVVSREVSLVQSVGPIIQLEPAPTTDVMFVEGVELLLIHCVFASTRSVDEESNRKNNIPKKS